MTLVRISLKTFINSAASYGSTSFFHSSFSITTYFRILLTRYEVINQGYKIGFIVLNGVQKTNVYGTNSEHHKTTRKTPYFRPVSSQNLCHNQSPKKHRFRDGIPEHRIYSLNIIVPEYYGGTFYDRSNCL